MYATQGDMDHLRAQPRIGAWRTFFTRLAFVAGMLALSLAVNFGAWWGLQVLWDFVAGATSR